MTPATLVLFDIDGNKTPPFSPHLSLFHFC
jgi:hypothetical protein